MKVMEDGLTGVLGGLQHLDKRVDLAHVLCHHQPVVALFAKDRLLNSALVSYNPRESMGCI